MRHATTAFVLLMVLSASALSEQPDTTKSTPTHYDVILLNNGAMIKGTIVNRVEGEKVTVRLQDGNTMDVPFKKIAAITTSDTDYEARHKTILDSLAALRPAESHFRPMYQLQLGGQVGSEDRLGGFAAVGGGVMTPQELFAGLTVGVDRNSEGTYVPLMCELDFFFKGHSVAPFVFFSAGYAIGWLDNYPSADFGGFRIHAGLGVRLPLSPNVWLTGRGGYVSQQVGKSTTPVGTKMDFLGLSAGLLF
ncbi:MAG: hypothetical protein AB1644_06355 [Candidatus Zixiibacteriota bacterium]